MMPLIKSSLLMLIGLCMLLMSDAIVAAEVTVEVRDAKGNLLKDTIVYLENAKTASQPSNHQFEIEQKGRQFNPQVSVVQTGTHIHFPNKDKVRHHVYSFSPAKKFELKLYSGVPANPITFDKAGTVVIGCNIHDTMLAYIYIVDTPYFAKTDSNGIAKISNATDDGYLLKVWHYALKSDSKPNELPIKVKAGMAPVLIQLDINDAQLI